MEAEEAEGGVKEMGRRKLRLLILPFLIATILYSCGGGGSSGNSSIANITIKEDNVSTTTFSKSTSDNITFSWTVKIPPTNTKASEEYTMTIYLSKTQNIDDSSVFVGSKVSTSEKDSLTVTKGSEGYNNIMNAYGGIYYVIFKATLSDGSYSIQYKPGFTLRNRWTVMVYMDGDNSLSSATTTDLNEMKNVGSNGDINIVVQDDTKTETTKRYFIEQDNIKMIKDMGELEMSDYKTLVDFAKWTIDNYPSDHYLLVLWDHGKGFERSPLTISRDIAWDDNPSPTSSMSIPSLGEALSEIKGYLGKKIDIIGMDACLMNMIEVAYQIKDYADYMVGSESLEPSNGWPYDKILKDLEDNTTMDAETLAKTIVEDYINNYRDSGFDYPTQTATNLSKLDNLSFYVNKLANSLIDRIDNSTIKETLTNTIFDSVQRFDDSNDNLINTDDNYVDLYHLAQLIHNNDNMTQDIKDAADEVLKSFNSCVVASEHINLTNAHGLSIWFPNENNYYNIKSYYELLRFAKNNNWNKFLNKLYR